MIVLLTLAAAWLLLLVVVLGMLHVATGTPTPGPAPTAPFTLPGTNVAAKAGPGPANGTPRAGEPVSVEAA